MDLETAKRLARHAARRVPFEGTMNCRDLGGLPTADGRTTAPGRVYRSGRLSNLTDADVERFRRLGVRQVFDLRLPFERERYPNRLPDGSGIVEHRHGYLPAGALEMFAAVNDGTITPARVLAEMQQQYAGMATGHPDVHGRLLRQLLAADATPLVLHCSGGKDRTGVASALLLRAAGVSREIVVADYLLTNLDTPPLGVLAGDVAPELAAIVGRAHVELIEAALDAVENAYPSYEAFLRGELGLSAAEYGSLLALLLD
ncbi:MAG: tyrosine-protein phosphatase [Gammaproteobacteria bacterium]